MIGMIAAVTSNGVIGVENKLPFNYPEDLKHFKKITNHSTVIMGRKTFESIGKALPNRRNIVISKKIFQLDNIEMCKSIDEAIKLSIRDNNVWFIGGASIYEAGMKYANKIILTITPDIELRTPSIKFPWINPTHFEYKGVSDINDSGTSLLKVATYNRIF